MPTTSERVARRARPCGMHPCDNTIEPGQTYRRHVGFPSDDGVTGPSPWVIDECADCVARNDDIQFSYVRDYYRVPAAKDMRVVANGQPGVIVGVASGRLLIRLDGERRARCYHPTWRIKYPAESAGAAA